MYKSSGFTLIELVIVIVILGILGAVAAPKFLNLQGDAYKANLSALKNSVNTAAVLGNAKAILNGYDTLEYALADSDNNFKRLFSGSGKDPSNIEFAFGYPNASGYGIIKMLQNSNAFSSAEDGSTYVYTHEGNSSASPYNPIRISMRGRGYIFTGNDKDKCELTYKHPTKAGEAPEVKLFIQGC